MGKDQQVLATVASVSWHHGTLTLWAGAPGAPQLSLFPSGTTCEVLLAPCAPGPCRNGGECKESEDYESFSCACPSGWQGEAARAALEAQGCGGGGVPGAPALKQVVVSSLSLETSRRAAEPPAQGTPSRNGPSRP